MTLFRVSVRLAGERLYGRLYAGRGLRGLIYWPTNLIDFCPA